MMCETVVETSLHRELGIRRTLPIFEGAEEAKEQHEDESTTVDSSHQRDCHPNRYPQQQLRPHYHELMSQREVDDQQPPSLSRRSVPPRATSAFGIPTTVSLRGGVRGGHSILSSLNPKIHPAPLGLSTDYFGGGTGGGPTNEHGPSSTAIPTTAPPGGSEWWPKGLSNVGNTCYANATLQCLLSTALTSALLDPKTVPILRRYSSNPNLLAMGSGSVASDDEDGDDEEEEEDGILRVVDSHGVASEAAAAAAIAYSRKTKKSKNRKKSQTTINNCNGYSYGEDETKRKERETAKLEENCKWLTAELTSITQDYMDESWSSRNLGASRSSMIGAWLTSTSGTDRDQVRQPCFVNPGSITRHPDRLSKCLRPYQQEDAHEFLRALLSTLAMNGHNKQLSSLFDGLLESSVTCETCGRASLTRDRYMDLSLDIHNVDIATLDDALYEFTKTELLTEDNAVFCQKCRKKRSVTKGLRLATAPSILVCHLKRFAYDTYGRLVRLHKRIGFPQRLEIGDFMSNLNKARPPPYELVGVLVHQGQTCASGHYLAFVKKNGEWFKCNDSEVTKVDEATVMMQQAYILMYEVAEMRENACFKPKPFKKEASIMTTIESDEAEMSKEDFSAHASHWSSEHSTSKRSYSRSSSFAPGHGHDETTAESFMRLLRDAGVTQFISDLCCDSRNDGINEPETHTLRKRNHNSNTGQNTNSNHSRSGRRNRKDNHAHECESVDTQDSLIRRHTLMNHSEVHVLEVEPKSSGRSHRAQTAPRQRLHSYENTEPGFDLVAPYATFTPRADGGGHHRKFPSHGGVSNDNNHPHGRSTSSTYARSKRREREQRDTDRSDHDRDRNSMAAARYTMQERGREDLPPLIPNPARRKSGNSSAPRKTSSSNVD
jgi:Ubiquitin carboxyl-terminal hydrolase